MNNDEFTYPAVYNPLKLSESAQCLECKWYAKRHYERYGKVFKLAKKHSIETGHIVSFSEVRGQIIKA